MAEYTIYERTRIKDGKEVKSIKVRRFRLPIILGKKDGIQHIIKKSTDMKFGPHIKQIGHVHAKSRKEAILKAMIIVFKGGNNAK